jgi:translation initiation factor 5A
METKQSRASGLKKGSYVLMDGEPSVVLENQFSRSGGRGAAKCKIIAVGMLTGRRREELHVSTDNLDVPIIGKMTAQVLSISEKVVNVMDMETYESFDLEMTEDVEGTPVEGGQVVYWQIADKKILKSTK